MTLNHIRSAAVAAFLVVSSAAHATLFDTSSTFTVQGTNSPGNFSTSVPLTPGSYSLSGGALTLNLSIVQSATPGAEWLVFNYSAPGGLTGNANAYWEIEQIGLTPLVDVYFTSAYLQFSVGDTVLTPTGNIFGGSIEANPVPGGTGTGVGSTGFQAGPYAANTPIGQLGAWISPFSFVGAMYNGTDPATITGWTQALEFTAVTPVPEPGTWMMMLIGFAGLGFVAYRTSRGGRSYAPTGT